ncbi:solute carrier family 22 member 3 isoform X2 [Achroia grisella]|uniref:solute carrier family 22 member 3 isoform X2 n=1 Tax=Achroia grisella TaxID=688607 RepID=UPI0027D247DB|nr:solute carrier family 22 member 3 isoform X2 [Achroia grisella]
MPSDCDDYDYDRTWYESTVASTNNWVCKDELNIANILAISKISEAIGSLGFGWFGDAYGRRWTYILSLAFLVLGRIISIVFSSSFTFFAIGCALAWFPSWSVVQSATVISMEISSPERRSRTATLRSIANSSSMFIMPFLYWWLRDWKTFMVVTTVTQLPFLLYSWKMIESPRWLWIEGKSKACVRTLKIIAKGNKTNLGLDTEKDIMDNASQMNTRGTNTIGPLALFSGRRLAINTILQSYLWVSVAINYTILMMKSGQKSDGNPFLEFAWQSVVEVPGALFGAWLADRVGRRYAGLISYTLTVLLWMSIALYENGSGEWHLWWLVGTTLTILTRLATATSYYVIYLFNMELYPTCLRQSGMSLGNLLASGGGAIAPYLLYIGHHVDVKLPYLILAGFSVFGCLSFFLLPETLNMKLPETLKDAQEFGKNRRNYFSLIIKKYKAENNDTC